MFLLFGNSVNSSDWGQVAGQESKFAQAFNLSQEYLSDRGRLGPFYWLLNDKAFRDACKTCHDFMDKGIAKALEAFVQTDHGGKGEHRDADTYVFVEALMQQTRDPRVLRDQCGGPDGKSPVLVRPGEGVGYCVYAMHRRKDIYGQDADEFRPERWEGDSLRDIGWAYLPFNGGPRLCLGQEFALLEVAYTVARLVQVFPKFELPRGEREVKVGQERQILTLVVASAEGCVVSLKD
ncbi:cytochrome P450 52A11, partial [Metarhizium hybridum]